MRLTCDFFKNCSTNKPVLPTSEAHLHSLLCSQDKFFAAVRCRLIGLLPAEVAAAEMAPSHTGCTLLY